MAMLRRCLLPAAFSMLAIITVACGSSSTPKPTPGSVGETMEAEAEPSPFPVVESEVAEAEPSPTPVAEAEEIEAEQGSGLVTDSEEADALRELAFGYWEAFNAYDADAALAYLEADYRQQRDETVRSEIGRMKPFRVRLGLSEESPPSVVSRDEREMYLTMKEPLGERRIRMAFRKVEGEWKITFVEEVK